MVVIYVFFAFICKKNNKNFAVQKLITNFAIRTNLLTFVKKNATIASYATNVGEALDGVALSP